MANAKRMPTIIFVLSRALRKRSISQYIDAY
jgi:hypothetical protein